MLQENLLIQLLSQGLSWRDSLSAEEQARHLNKGETTQWREEVMASAESLGIPKILRQVAFSSRHVTAWGIYLDSILDLFGIPELQGLACDSAKFVEKIASKEPKTWEEVKKLAIDMAGEYLKKQIETGDVYLLHPSKLTAVEFSSYVPTIVELRSKHLDQSRPYLMDDGLIDMFDFLELPITLELMLESGVGGRATPERAKTVLDRMNELELIPNNKLPTEKREVKRNIEEQYLKLYQNCEGNHAELLRGTAMAYDPDENICKKGIELIHATGHAHSLQPLLLGLDRQDNEIIRLSVTGLGILGDPVTTDMVANVLVTNQEKEVQMAACTALGQLKGEKHLGKIIGLVSSSDDQLALTAMKALLSVNTSESVDKFWQQLQRFGMPKLAGLSKEIAASDNYNSVIFLMGLLLLDLQTFVYTGEVQFYNMFVQLKEGKERELLMTMVNLMRQHAVTGFGRLGDTGVPVLVSLLKVFPETRYLFQNKKIWESSEVELEKAVTDRIYQYQRLPRADGYPTPIVEAIRALGVTHSERAIPFLEEIGKMDNEEFVDVAMEALSEIDIPAIDVLLDVKASTPKLKLKKIHEVGTIVHPKVTQWLIEQLDDSDPFLRMQAASFLAMRNDPELNKPLLKAAKDSHKGVRAGLANVIIRLGMDTYPDVMSALSEDKDGEIRKIITQAQIAYKADQNDDYWA